MLYEPPPQIPKFNWIWAKWIYGVWEKFFKYGNYPPLPGEISVNNGEYEYGDLRRFGVTGDGSAVDLTKISNAITSIHTGGRVFGQADHIYNFGDIAGDTYAITVTKNIVLDWQGAKLLCAGNNGSSYTGTGLFQFLDCVCDMRNYDFEDTNFTFSGPSRGVKPVTISSVAASTQGHRIGPCHIIKGQSLLTCGSGTPATYRASDIQLIGPITGEQVYYGLNLAKNGDRVRGSYFIEEYNRLALIYDIDDVDILIHGGGTPSPSSANLFVSNFGSMDTTNIKIKAIFDELNGQIRIADDFANTAGTGVFRNIHLDVEVKSYGSNLPSTSNEITAIGTQNSGGWESSSTVKMDNVTVDFKSETVPTNPIVKRTTSPNYGVFRFPSLHPNKGAIQEFTWQEEARFSKHIASATLSVAITGATQADPVVVSATAHGFTTSDVIPIYDAVGMTEINDFAHTVTVINANSFSLDGVDGTGYTAWSSGGTAHASASLKVSDVITDEASTNWGLDVIINGAFDSAFSGQKTVIERQSVHGYTSSGSVVTLSGNNQAYQSKTGGDTPTIHFLKNGADIVAAIKGYTTTVGSISFYASQLR